MNVKDVESPIWEGETDRLELIFKRQRELMEKYHPIELGKGLLHDPDIPVNINHHNGQAVLKDFAWRITEELAEAGEAFFHLDDEHTKEELADAFHFLVELAILSDVEWSDILEDFVRDRLESLFERSGKEEFGIAVYNVLLSLGKAMNCLKNKPWKQSQILTDEEKYKENIVGAFYNIAVVCKSAGMDADQLFSFYFRKSEVNKFRQRSQY